MRGCFLHEIRQNEVSKAVGFRDSGNGGIRRRRVLIDESTTPDKTQDSVHRKGKLANMTSYTNAARFDRQARVTDLIPKRIISIGLWFLSGVASICGLESLHIYGTQLAELTGSNHALSLGLTGPGSLAAWFSSSLLAMTAVMAVMIYSIRRHKVDDYRGRYRIWLWAALVLIVASMDATARLHALLPVSLTKLSGIPLTYGNQSAWWLVGWGMVGCLIGLWLFVDMRQCRSARLASLLCIGLYAAAVGFELNWIQLNYVEPINTVVASSTGLSGHLMLFMIAIIYARYVYLDAQGKIGFRSLQPVESIKSKRAKSTIETTSTSVSGEDTDVEKSPSHRKTDLDPGQEDVVANMEDDAHVAADDQPRKLSKAERRKLRKQMRNQRHAA